MGQRVVVDDIRIQPEGWLLFKTAEEFLDWRKSNNSEEITVLSLDHDLGEEVMSGYDLVKRLVMEDSMNIKSIQFHTDNPVGFRNMYHYLASAKKHDMYDGKISSEKFDLIDGVLKSSGYNFGLERG